METLEYYKAEIIPKFEKQLYHPLRERKLLTTKLEIFIGQEYAKGASLEYLKANICLVVRGQMFKINDIL